MEPAIVLARLAAFVAGAALFGAPLFVIYNGRTEGAQPRLLRPVLLGASLAFLLAADIALIAQTGQMAGDLSQGLDAATLHDVLTTSAFGHSIVARAAAGFVALVLLLRLGPGRRYWRTLAGLGAIGLGALAWDGHGAADPGVAGWVHTAADVIHLLAAGVWLGALLCLGLLLTTGAPPGTQHEALKGFSGIGSVVVAALLASGLINTWFLVGPQHLDGLVSTTWGRLLLGKLVLVAAMLGLAAFNRWKLTPRLEGSLALDPGAALKALRRSVGLESALGLLVLGLVAVLGVQPPPASF